MTPSTERVRDLGEFGLIKRLENQLPDAVRFGDSDTLGIGDDAALWTPTSDVSVVITTDALIETVHFRLDWTDWTSLGHKMLAVNISDIAAMGGKPKLATIALGLTGEELVQDIEALYVGAGGLAAAHGVMIAGGDIVRVPHDISLCVTLIGEVEKSRAVARNGARPGDLVVVSGTLGASAAGMALLQRGTDHMTTGSLLVGAHLRPNPRVALGRIMHDGGVTAAMDISDRLLGDLAKILEASKVSAILDVAQLPILPAVHALFPDRFEQFALNGGEDYELLMTVPEEQFPAFQKQAGDIAATLTVVGRIVERTDQLITLHRAGQLITDPSGSWDHFG